MMANTTISSILETVFSTPQLRPRRSARHEVELPAIDLALASAQFCAAQRNCSNLEMDWLWLATRVDDGAEQRYCYLRALQINPHSELAREGLRRLDANLL
jgi:hypothetical protein